MAWILLRQAVNMDIVQRSIIEVFVKYTTSLVDISYGNHGEWKCHKKHMWILYEICDSIVTYFTLELAEWTQPRLTYAMFFKIATHITKTSHTSSYDFPWENRQSQM